MKIALVSPYDFPYPGGVTEHIAALDEHLRALGHETRIIVATSSASSELSEHVIKISGTIVPITMGGATARVTYSPRVYYRAKKILREEKFDIVHVHEPTIPMVSMAVLEHSHAINVGTFHAYRDSFSTYAYMRPLFARFIDRLDGRIFVSPIAQDFGNRYFPGESVVIPNGIDTARFSAPDLEPLPQFNDGRPNLLFVGRMDTRKGFRHLLRAFPYIQKEIPGVRLLVVGAFDARETAPLERYARTHQLSDVHFVGHISRAELPRYYKTATLFCAPSTGAESFGIVLLEAMAAGVPIIASNIPGYRGLLQNNLAGCLVTPGDEHALTRVAIELLRDPARRAQMGEQGKRTAAQYDWDIIARRIIDYYDQLSAAKRVEHAYDEAHQKLRVSRLLRSLRVMGL